MKRVLGAGVLSLGLAAACGGSSDSGGESSPTDCAGATQVLCERINACYPYLVQAFWGSVDACASRSKLSCEASLAAPGAATTPEQIGACASAYSKQSCDMLLGGSEPAECNVPGTRNDGEPCGVDGQCKSTNCKINSGECGACAPKVAAGGSCEVDDDCDANLTCVKDVCAVPVPAGGACTTTDQCLGALRCKSGTCAQGAAAGSPCDPQQQDCDSLQGLYCDSESKLCTLVSWAKVGEACGLVAGKYVACQQGECQDGTCGAYAADGAACNDETGPGCLEPASCVNGTCKLPSAASCG